VTSLNLGILAHVDAGKTSLTERLLFAAGVIDQVGSVDRGSTQTDSLALERARGITIKAAVVSFGVGDLTVNLIDTPGHPDFIAEVERVLNVLDGAVLVVSAVEGVQAQTRILLRTLRRLGIPTLIFANKVDRSGARDVSLLADIRARLSPDVVALTAVASGLGTRAATVRPLGPDDPGHVEALTELLAASDDALLTRYLGGQPVPYAELRDRLARRTRCATAYPVFFGSAITGAGTDLLTDALPDLLPASAGDPRGPLAGRVFKIDRGPGGQKQAYARLFSGTVRTRERVVFGAGHEGKVTGIRVFARGTDEPHDTVRAGQIAKLSGLAAVQIGDDLGPSTDTSESAFAPPTLETIVAAEDPTRRGALYAALSQLAEQDPLINLRLDPETGEVAVSLYGEVQKEVIAATLADDFDVQARFTETTVLCIERPVGVGSALEVGDTPTNPLLATVGLRVEPGPPGSGIAYAVAGEKRGTLPPAFFTAVEETVPLALQHGRLGWPVTDCCVTLTHTGYWPRQSHAHAVFDKSMSSTAGDFRALTPMVLQHALAAAGTAVYEPVHRFRLELPADLLGPILPSLSRLGAVPLAPGTAGALAVVEGEVPAARVQALMTQLPGLTRGEGVLETSFDHYDKVRGEAPRRLRATAD
jgi:ribosomal protection tetracycline resistance protein